MQRDHTFTFLNIHGIHRFHIGIALGVYLLLKLLPPLYISLPDEGRELREVILAIGDLDLTCLPFAT